MTEYMALQTLRDVDAIITDSHIVYTSGLHGTTYVNKDALYPHTTDTAYLCREIAEHFSPYGETTVQVVVGPTMGGIILSQWVAYYLSKTGFFPKRVLGAYADKTDDGGFVIKRGYDKLIAGKRVLVVEDVITTGGSVRKVVEETRRVGGNVVGVGALCNRGGVTSHDVGGVPELFSLVNIKLDTWDEKNCPLCKDAVPINTDVGKGKEFLARVGKQQ